MLSFVVPAHDEERVLGPTLESIRTAAEALGVAFETIVVDDASSDATGAVALAHGARVVRVEHRQIARTRNSGARAARGEVLVFVDADTEISARVLRETLDALGSGAVGGGALVRLDEPVPLWGRLVVGIVQPLFRLARLSAGAYMYCTRAAFAASGGYDERLYGGEEIRFARALQRVGRFVLLRARVTTSARKLRTHSPREVLGFFARAAWRGERAVQSREGMDLWYGARRDDPAATRAYASTRTRG